MDKVTVILSLLGIGVFLWFFPELIGIAVTVGVIAATKFIIFDSALLVSRNHHAPEERLYGNLWRAPEHR